MKNSGSINRKLKTEGLSLTMESMRDHYQRANAEVPEIHP